VPQRSIADIELNMTRPEVKDTKGDPDRIVHGTNDFGSRRGRPRRLARERAPRGVSASSLPHGELRLPPLLDRPLPSGRPREDYRIGIATGKVKSVTVAFVID
jgi:hypothetical protein